MSEGLFWSAALMVAYPYLLFPVLLALRGILRSQTRPQPSQDAQSVPGPAGGDGTTSTTPSVSLLVAAHNEAGVIEQKLQNLLSLDYPQECLEIIVASDGSDDGTNERVQQYEPDGVRLLALPRRGKAHALNTAAQTARGDILVFSDANSIYAEDALRHLVRPFADDAVGGVAGNQRYLSSRDVGLAGRGEKQYWSLDRRLKQLESAAGNVISATGAIYAVRRPLFRPIPDGVTDDFYNSTGVIERGYRLVFAPQAVAYETISTSNSDQFRRKVRIITRGLRAVYERRRLLNPLTYGFYALQLFSHKVLRRLVIFPLMALLPLSLRLWRRHPVYRLAAVAQVAFYSLAAVGAALQRAQRQAAGRASSPLFSLPYYFCMVNLAALVAVLNTLRGRRIVLWEPEEREA